jgi:ribosomal protein L21E
LQLANLLLQCQTWAEIENAISLYEAYKTEAWKLLDSQQQRRIKTLKVRSVLRVGSRVCIDPSSWSPLSPYIGKLGTVRKVTDFGYYEVQPDGENKRINYGVEDLKPVETPLGFRRL